MSGGGPAQVLALDHTRDGRPILTLADLQDYDPRPQRSGGRDRYYCPIHGGDNQRSLSVDPDTGKYTCHACGASGTLRDFWPDASAAGTPKAPKKPTLEQMGRADLAARARADQDHAERLAGAIPATSAAFLAQLPALQEALRDPACPGVVYLRGRGLDAELAAELGAGYAPPNTWPGDKGRKVGRIVYPLADPVTGRVVSAVGRLCMDAQPGWSEDLRTGFKDIKQRKLFGCPAGVWPQASIAAAHADGAPLVVVEGPADALALLQGATDPLQVVALLGTANVLPAAATADLVGVVLALDDDDGGSKGARALRADLAIAGVPVATLPAGWLGACGAKDPADLAAGADGACYATAMAAVHRAGRALRTGWDAAAAEALLTAMYTRCSAVFTAAQSPDLTLDAALDAAIDAACTAQNGAALQQAIAAYETAFQAAVAAMRRDDEPPTAATDGDVLHGFWEGQGPAFGAMHTLVRLMRAARAMDVLDALWRDAERDGRLGESTGRALGMAQSVYTDRRAQLCAATQATEQTSTGGDAALPLWEDFWTAQESYRVRPRAHTGEHG